MFPDWVAVECNRPLETRKAGRERESGDSWPGPQLGLASCNASKLQRGCSLRVRDMVRVGPLNEVPEQRLKETMTTFGPHVVSGAF